MALYYDDDRDAREAGWAIATLGLIAHVVTGPVIHANHSPGGGGDDWRVWTSVAMRSSMAVTAPVIAAMTCDKDEAGECPREVLVGSMAAGVLAPVLFE